ncbi:hypothetical protein KZH41_19225 [Pseudomonas sp. YeP6b]|uniref:hypothetical protein n=1 Tax=Pseudomonas sp. YeP6b TaxID=2861775 RepID=UPI0021D96507|nr:hypothetical protein [Pseudomonas sp. YeP6b]UXZ20652.1 hypothetical protein KZH41_19225 [Pseudomonas sp. YeP6b]
MDFPKSVPGVGLINGQFIDENMSTGQPGSLIPSVWGNSVTHEILNVLVAGGVVPDELKTNQLAEAIAKIVKVTSVDWSKVTSTPKNLSGYGIDDAVAKTGSTISGTLTFDNGTSDSPEIQWITPTSSAIMDIYNDIVRISAAHGGKGLNPLLLHLPSKTASIFDKTVWTAGNFDPATKLGVGEGGIVAKASPQAENVNTLPYGGLWSINPGTLGAPFANGNVIHCAYDVSSGNWLQIFGDLGGVGLSWRSSLNRSISNLKTIWDSDNFKPNSKVNATRCANAGFADDTANSPFLTHSNGTTVGLARADAGIGYNRKYVDVTASRAANVVYTNDTGAPMAITISFATAYGGEVASIYVGGVLIYSGDLGVETQTAPVTFIVPKDSVYSLTLNVTRIQRWVELR